MGRNWSINGLELDKMPGAENCGVFIQSNTSVKKLDKKAGSLLKNRLYSC